jgi:hypothetical protein
MFCTLLLVFGGSEGVGSRFQVLCDRTCFSAVPRAPGPVFMFSAPEIVSRGTEGVRSRFHVLRSRTHFRRYRGRRVPISCFPRPDSFSAVPRASGSVFMFCSPGLVFGGTTGVGSRFHVLHSFTRFRRTEGVESRFHVLLARTRFRRDRRRQVPF